MTLTHRGNRAPAGDLPAQKVVGDQPVAVYRCPMAHETELVDQLASKANRLHAMRALMGAVNARQLRTAAVTEAAFDALVEGLSHANPQVRWWSVQLLDHCPDPRAVDAIVPLLDDPVARVRRNAAHALSCKKCKPSWSGELNESVIERLSAMARTDPNAKVRAEAITALTCLTQH